MLKDVYKFDKGKEWTERKQCHPQKIASCSKFIAPYWWDALYNVFNYDKRRDLQESHHLVDDSRIQKGLKLYREGHIDKWVVTKHNYGDVLAYVKSEDMKRTYTVVIKNFLPKKLPQYNHEREEYFSDLYVFCTCTDACQAHYRSNSSIICKHVASLIWLLQDRFDAPKIFLSPEERIVGYQKSNVEEIATGIKILPLIKFRYFINILMMKKYRGMKNALGISLHKINNETDKEDYKPIWLSMTEPKEIIRMIKAMTTVLNTMCDKDEQYEFGQKALITKKQTPRWITWPPRDVALLKRYYPDKGTNIPDLKTCHTPLAIRLKAHRLKIRYYRKNKNHGGK